ncbi:MAG: type II toxin-antitoxin system death-on-curing family toxin [Ignavibacteria bacterium]
MDIRNPEIIVELHDELIHDFGGEPGILSINLLLSSLARPFSGTSNGIEFFPSIEDKSAALIHSLIQNHPFVDGNKRTAAQVTKIFLREYNYDWVFGDDEIVDFVLDIANNLISFLEIKNWISCRISKLNN